MPSPVFSIITIRRVAIVFFGLGVAKKIMQVDFLIIVFLFLKVVLDYNSINYQSLHIICENMGSD